MIPVIMFFGFLFGAILQYSKLNRYDTISGMALLNNYTMAKAIAVAIGFGIILVNIEIGLGFASYHIKPVLLGGIMIGGLIFGIGMAILGYCPGTLPISMGEGSIDAMIGMLGALFGGVVYTVILPSVKWVLGPDLGQISLKSIIGDNTTVFYLLILLTGSAILGVAFWLNKIEKAKDFKWFFSGIALAILTSAIFLTATTGRVLGASTFYPYLGDLITGTTGNDYFKSTVVSGHWEMYFLIGALLSGVILSLIRRDFRFVLIHNNWREYKGDSKIKRIIWSFVGGFLLIIGARMAGGCTSGHIISGGMQLAVSSYLFAVFVFGSFLLTGKFFYKINK
jgi:uncharacterized protein